MSFLAKRSSVIFIMWIIMCSSSRTTFSKISKLMNMHSMFAIRIQSFNRACNFGWWSQLILTEGYYSSYLWLIWIKYTNGMSFGISTEILIHKKRTKTQSRKYTQTSFQHYYYLWQLYKHHKSYNSIIYSHPNTINIKIMLFLYTNVSYPNIKIICFLAF